MMFTDEKHAEMITNLSEATVPDRGGSKLLLPKSKPPPASAAPSMGAALDLDFSEHRFGLLLLM